MNIKIPFLPPSINKIYGWNKHTGQQYLKREARQFKDNCKMFIPKFDDTQFNQKELTVKIEYHGNWYYKNGNIKRHDGQNMNKALYDALFEAINTCDSHIFECYWVKVQDENEHIIVTIDNMEVCDEQEKEEGATVDDANV